MDSIALNGDDKNKMEKSKNASPIIYLTLVSIIASLTFGYLLNGFDLTKIRGDQLGITYCLQTFVSFFAIIIFWHEYAMSTVYFKWSLGYFDSFLPFLFGLTLFSIVKSIGINCWFYALSSYTFIGTIAYSFQSNKTRNDDYNKNVLLKLRNYHPLTIKVSFLATVVFLCFGIIIDLHSSSTWLFIFLALIANIIFLSYIILVRTIWRRAIPS